MSIAVVIRTILYNTLRLDWQRLLLIGEHGLGMDLQNVEVYVSPSVTFHLYLTVTFDVSVQHFETVKIDVKISFLFSL